MIDYKVPTNDHHIGDCLWGKLASDILTQNWEQSLMNLIQLREWIDKNEVLNSLLFNLNANIYFILLHIHIFFLERDEFIAYITTTMLAYSLGIVCLLSSSKRPRAINRFIFHSWK
jgi:hypothetical protein